jgi:hypothetical protein
LIGGDASKVISTFASLYAIHRIKSSASNPPASGSFSSAGERLHFVRRGLDSQFARLGLFALPK